MIFLTKQLNYKRFPYHACTMITKGWCEVRRFLKGMWKAFTQLVTVCFYKVILHLFATDNSITTQWKSHHIKSAFKLLLFINLKDFIDTLSKLKHSLIRMRRAHLDHCLKLSSWEIVTVISYQRTIWEKSRHTKPTMSCKFDNLD